jgi:hypothetical protein
MKIVNSLICAAVLLTVACASSQKGSGIPSGAAFWLKVRAEKTPFARTIAAPMDQTANKLAETFYAMGYPGSFADGASDIYITRQLDVKGRLYDGELNSLYFDCGRSAGGGVVADEYALSFVIAARIERAGTSSSQVEVLIDASARSLTQSGTAIPCRGTGKLENLILTALAARLI